LFRAWLCKIARNAVCRHFTELTREVSTVDLADAGDGFAADIPEFAGGSAFEFQDWMTFLTPRERDVMTPPFVQGWEYNEIAAAQAIPIGTVQWRVFNSKKKLSLHLNRRQELTRKAA
jgi:DNA-directed RNA polymerase specialized sigma24 family protein